MDSEGPKPVQESIDPIQDIVTINWKDKVNGKPTITKGVAPLKPASETSEVKSDQPVQFMERSKLTQEPDNTILGKLRNTLIKFRKNSE
jgi:hypothetical protein